MKIRIPIGRNSVVLYQILYVLVVFLLISLGLPNAFKYLTDVLLILGLFYSFGRLNKSVALSKARNISYVIIAIVACAIIGIIINLVNPIQALWGARNSFRFFAFFIICIAQLRLNNVESIFSLLKKVFWLNIPVASFEYFVLGLKNDYCGGLFGFDHGCNGLMNVFICMIICICLGEYLYKKINLTKFIGYLLGCLYLAILAELKVVFFELVLVVILSNIIKRPSFKNIMTIIATLGVLLIGVGIIEKISPDTLNFFTDIERQTEYLGGEGYSGAGQVNRFTAIPILYDMFFDGSFVKALFGFGLGNCDTSSFSFLQSDFYEKYEGLKYRWFTHSWTFLEQGGIGLSLIFIFFVMIILFAILYKKEVKNPHYLIISATFSLTCLIGIIYNNALNYETAYLIAFLSSVAYIAVKEEQISVNENTQKENKPLKQTKIILKG